VQGSDLCKISIKLVRGLTSDRVKKMAELKMGQIEERVKENFTTTSQN
jgi:hypothetical protein